MDLSSLSALNLQTAMSCRGNPLECTVILMWLHNRGEINFTSRTWRFGRCQNGHRRMTEISICVLLPWLSKLQSLFVFSPGLNMFIVNIQVLLCDPESAHGILFWKCTRCTMLFCCLTFYMPQPALCSSTQLRSASIKNNVGPYSLQSREPLLGLRKTSIV